MAVIQVKKIPRPERQPGRKDQILAEFCYYYPAYTLAAARKLAAKDVLLLLKMARTKQAELYLHLTNIAAAPHTKDAAGVRQLIENYKRNLGGE